MNAPAKQQAQPQHDQAPPERVEPEPFKGWDDQTYFVVIDEGEEDGRLRNEVGRRCKGVSPGKIVSGLHIARLSERHKVCLVFRPHVPFNRDFRTWPIKITEPLEVKNHWTDADGLDVRAFANAVGKAIVPATAKYRDEGDGGGIVMRIRYA